MKTKLVAICATAVFLLGVNAAPASAAIDAPRRGWIECLFRPWTCPPHQAVTLDR